MGLPLAPGKALPVHVTAFFVIGLLVNECIVIVVFVCQEVS